jgi:dihydroorotase
MQSMTLTQPDDWHLHLRDGDMLSRTVADSARQFSRAMVMPNLVPPITNTAMAMAYYHRLTACNTALKPLMTLYLTDHTDRQDVITARQCGQVQAIKLYPAGATTNSSAGITAIENTYEALEAMQEVGMPLLVHGELTTAETDIFEREKCFIDEQLQPLLQRFSHLKVVLEHISTADAVAFVTQADDRVAATITPQHLLYNRNHLLSGGIKPHLYCLPILKHKRHQWALQQAAISGNPKFFLGTDSAPHPRNAKESACGCAGCYSSPVAMELYAQAFDQLQAMDKLEGFASHFGADYYGFPRNKSTITLIKKPWQVPSQLDYVGQTIIPLGAGETLNWQLLP